MMLHLLLHAQPAHPLAHPHASDHEMEDPEGQSMFNAIDTSKVRCLNESAAGSCVHPFKPYSRVSHLKGPEDWQ